MARPRVSAVALSILTGCFCGCIRDGRFECDEAEVDGPRLCDQGGRCVEGSCAYADAECASGWRFASYAEPGGECTVCGGSEQECCSTSPACDPGLACTGGVCGCLVNVAAGGSHVCALDTAGSVQCWGDNDTSQVDSVAEDPRPPVEIALTGVEALAAGEGHTCARTQQGQIWCWGANESGQLGGGGLVGRGVPGQVGLPAVIDLDAGDTHTCAVTSDGQVWCWGSNLYQELGQTGLDHSPIPLPVASLPPVDQIALGDRHSCARSATDIYCWGDNQFLQLGSETEGSTAIPQHVVDDATTLVAGDSHNCVARDGFTYCWGHGQAGQLGHGLEGGEGNEISVPIQVVDLPSTTPVAAGFNYSCAVDQGGALYCWGSGGHGQLGEGEAVNRSRPVRVAGIERASAAVSAGDRFTCAIVDSQLWCWGDNEERVIFPSDAVTVLLPLRMPVECR